MVEQPEDITLENENRPFFKVWARTARVEETRSRNQTAKKEERDVKDKAMNKTVYFIVMQRTLAIMVQSRHFQSAFLYSIETDDEHLRPVHIQFHKDVILLNKQVVSMDSNNLVVNQKGFVTISYCHRTRFEVSENAYSMAMFLCYLLHKHCQFTGTGNNDLRENLYLSVFGNRFKDIYRNSDSTINMSHNNDFSKLVTKVQIPDLQYGDESKPKTALRCSGLAITEPLTSETAWHVTSSTNHDPILVTKQREMTLTNDSKLSTLDTRVCSSQKAQINIEKSSKRSEFEYVETDARNDVKASDKMSNYLSQERENLFDKVDNFWQFSDKNYPQTESSSVCPQTQKRDFIFEKEVQSRGSKQNMTNAHHLYMADVVNIHSNTCSHNDAFDNRSNYMDTMSNKKVCRCSKRINSDNKSKHIRHYRNVCENYYNNEDNRNNSNENTKRCKEDMNTNDNHNDNDSSDSEIECVCSENNEIEKVEVEDERSRSGLSPTDQSVDGANSKTGSEDYVEEYTTTPVHDDQGLTQQGNCSNLEENIIYPFSTANYNIKRSSELKHSELFETNTTCQLTCSDVERHLDGKQDKICFNSSNEQLLNLCSQSEMSQSHINMDTFSNIHVEFDKEKDVMNVSDVDQIDITDIVCSTNFDINSPDSLNENNSLHTDFYSLSDVSHYATREAVCEEISVVKELCDNEVHKPDIHIAPTARDENVAIVHAEHPNMKSTHLVACMKDKRAYENVEVGNTTTELNESSLVFNIELANHVVQKDTANVINFTKFSFKDVESVHFLSLLTQKLQEYANKDTVMIQQKSVITSTEKMSNIQSDEPSVRLTNTVTHATNNDDLSSNTVEKNPSSSVRQQQDEQFSAAACSLSACTSIDCAMPLNESRILSKKLPCSSAKEGKKKDVLKQTSQYFTHEVLRKKHRNSGTRVSEEVVSQESSVSSQKRGPSQDLRSKSLMFLNDQCLPVSEDTLQLEPKVKQMGTQTAPPEKTGAESSQTDISYKVDVFKTMEYATSLSCGHSRDDSCQVTTAWGYAASREQHRNSQLKQSTVGQILSRSDNHIIQPEEKKEESEKCPDVSGTQNVIEDKGLVQASETNIDSYNKARILRATQRRKKLMNEIEEITSLADACNWPRYANKSYVYEQRNMFDDYIGSNQVNVIDATTQSVDQQIIGTLTIEYLNPSINGLIYLK